MVDVSDKSRILAVIIGMTLGITTKSFATVDFQTLAVEHRMNEIRSASAEKAQETVPHKDSESAFEEEKKLVAQQMTVITGEEDTKYIIVPGDTLQVSFKDQGKVVSSVYKVNGQGEIAMPLIGNAKVIGLNRRDARAHLNEMMTDYIRDPQLAILINAAGKYIVMGAAGPGVYPLESNLTVMEAVIKAGFDAHRANIGHILVMRGGPDKPVILKLNLKKMMLKNNREDNIALKPDDLIYIPNTFFYDFDNFKDKMFSYLADYYTLGGATLLQPHQAQNPTQTTQTTGQ